MVLGGSDRLASKTGTEARIIWGSKRWVRIRRGNGRAACAPFYDIRHMAIGAWSPTCVKTGTAESAPIRIKTLANTSSQMDQEGGGRGKKKLVGHPQITLYGLMRVRLCKSYGTAIHLVSTSTFHSRSCMKRDKKSTF